MKVFNKHHVECGGIGDPLRTQTMDDSLAPVLCSTSCYIISYWFPWQPQTIRSRHIIRSMCTLLSPHPKGQCIFPDRSLLYSDILALLCPSIKSIFLPSCWFLPSHIAIYTARIIISLHYFIIRPRNSSLINSSCLTEFWGSAMDTYFHNRRPVRPTVLQNQHHSRRCRTQLLTRNDATVPITRWMLGRTSYWALVTYIYICLNTYGWVGNANVGITILKLFARSSNTEKKW